MTICPIVRQFFCIRMSGLGWSSCIGGGRLYLQYLDHTHALEWILLVVAKFIDHQGALSAEEPNKTFGIGIKETRVNVTKEPLA